MSYRFLAAALLAFPLACSSGGERPELASSGGTGPGGSAGEQALPLPFAVTQQYVPTGFMGDAVAGTALLLDTSCPLTPAEDAQGDCFRLRYVPSESKPIGWAGLYFQSERDNWGNEPGKLIEPGAVAVSFYAAASAPVRVKFLVGGMGTASTPYKDSFTVDEELEVGTEFAHYSLDLSDVEYERVLGGFGFVIAKADTDGSEVALYLDGVIWH